MLTLFSIPKAFTGHERVIQRNALASWTHLEPACEILIFGDDPGVAEATRELGVTHIPEVARNQYGTPLLSFVFQQAQEHARHAVVCYANADIVLLPQFGSIAQHVPAGHFMLTGRRWNLDIEQELDFSVAGWPKSLEQRARREGELYRDDALDYFCFRKGRFLDMPPFAVGRPGWDNWFVYQARRTSARVIDATPAVTAIHQNHGYGHVVKRTGPKWQGPEAEENRRLRGETGRFSFNLQDATHILTPDGLRRRPVTRELLHRRWRTLAYFNPWLRKPHSATRLVFYHLQRLFGKGGKGRAC